MSTQPDRQKLSGKRIIRVAVPCPLYQSFDYLLEPATFDSKVCAGMRVRVPFGRQNLIGIIIEQLPESDIANSKLKTITAVLDEDNLLSDDVLKLLLWSSRYYVHPLGDALQTALPVYLRSHDDATSQRNICWSIDTAAPHGPDEIKDVLKRAPKQLQVYQLFLARGAGDSGAGDKDDGNRGAGDTAVLNADTLDADTLNTLTENWRPAVRSLLEKGLLKQHVKPTVISATDTDTQAIRLNADQRAAVSAIENHAHQHAVHVLHGITGSGKTEVYLALCKSLIADKKQVLVLVPEIGLTPQLTRRFLDHLDADIVVLHSAMNDRQRYTSWHAAASNQAQLIIGTRSSVFTPMPELGLIIVDEEHDGSYKQQDGFRYNARDLAIVRAKDRQIPIVLGSATPSLETLNNINEQRYTVHYLKQRANRKPLPAISLINLCNQQLQEGMADTLLTKIRHHLEHKGQVLLFINRRGFAPLLMCHDCGWTTNCQRCDAHMTYHKRQHRLHCHHCGSQRPAPDSCADCGSSDVIAIGAGTERIENFLQAYFPDTSVSRIDRDTTRNKGSLEEKLEQARSGESGILVGTQMLAKGHDFPNITLVCILDTDQALFSADFRATEHLAQLITQVAGRAGRAEKAGEVLIQTHHPEHPLLQTLLHDGYSAFAEAALQEREAAGLPPARRLALLRCESVTVDAAQSFLRRAMALTEEIDSSELDLYGPLPAPMERRAGRYRYQIMLQSAHRKPLLRFLSWWAPLLQQLPSARKVRWSLDVDPYDTF